MNLKSLPTDVREHILEQAIGCKGKVSAFGQNVFQFEHGAKSIGSPVGCGVDHAHLHTVPLEFDLIDALKQETDGTVKWTDVEPGIDPWVTDEKGDYYVVVNTDTNRAMYGSSVVPVSQLIRKVIAKKMGVTESWNYKNNPFTENIRHTIRAFDDA